MKLNYRPEPRYTLIDWQEQWVYQNDPIPAPRFGDEQGETPPEVPAIVHHQKCFGAVKLGISSFKRQGAIKVHWEWHTTPEWAEKTRLESIKTLAEIWPKILEQRVRSASNELWDKLVGMRRSNPAPVLKKELMRLIGPKKPVDLQALKNWVAQANAFLAKAAGNPKKGATAKSNSAKKNDPLAALATKWGGEVR